MKEINLANKKVSPIAWVPTLYFAMGMPFVVLNMVWSDEWGVLHNYVSPDQEVRVCAELAQAKLEDVDKVFSVRKYFGV